MNEPQKREPCMADEVEAIKTGLQRREQQLSALEKKLQSAEDELGLNLDDIELPENRGAILSEEPNPVAEKDEPKSNEVLPTVPHKEETVQADVAPDPSSIQPATQQLPNRDPAVIELLAQSAGLVQRNEHMRISVENLDKKIDAMARELHHWREKDAQIAAEKAAAPAKVLGMTVPEIKRLAVMGGLFLFIVIVWHLVTR